MGSIIDKARANIGPILVAIVIAALCLALAYQCSVNRTAATKAKLDAKQGKAAITSGKDATDTVANRADADASTDALTRTNADEILSADGANTTVPAGVRAAGLASLCRRAAYHGRPECVQHPNPR